MKTLIFIGSPRKNGDTMSLVNVLCEGLQGEYKIVFAYDCNVSACLDCRYCWKNEGCAIDDEMQEIYDYIQDSDNILIASPVYFSMLTGKLLDVTSRLQTYFCSRFFRKTEPILKKKRGAVLLVGGGDGHLENAYGTASTILQHMNTGKIFPLVSTHMTNDRPAIEDANVVRNIEKVVNFFNRI